MYFFVYLLLFSCSLWSSPAERIRSTEEGLQDRWRDCIADVIDLPLWSPGLSESDLRTRFDSLFAQRLEVYFENPSDFDWKGFTGVWKKEFEIPDEFSEWHSRYTHSVAFEYSLASPFYNASILSLHGLHFLALEAPCEANEEGFFNVLEEYNVTDLVRLTPVSYKGRESCVPYWEGRLDIHPNSGMSTISLPNRTVNYFPTDSWKDHQGTEIKKLFAMVKTISNSEIEDQKVIAVHCRAGVGRTGTLIGAYVLAHDIDEQIANGIKPENIKISVEKVVWEMGLQRAFMVIKFAQYLTLHRFVDHYVEMATKS